MKNLEFVEIICNDCNIPMTFESIAGNSAIYICEKCKHEVKLISIRNKGVSEVDSADKS